MKQKEKWKWIKKSVFGQMLNVSLLNNVWIQEKRETLKSVQLYTKIQYQNIQRKVQSKMDPWTKNWDFQMQKCWYWIIELFLGEKNTQMYYECNMNE